MVEDELRKSGKRLRDLDVPLELGLQESVRSAVQGGFGVGFISRRAVATELAAGTLTEARIRGLDLARDIYIARAAGRAGSSAAQGFVAFARERLSA
jgi:LysR family transcriptional regulator, low CO2-responsive transcriptional regulator